MAKQVTRQELNQLLGTINQALKRFANGDPRGDPELTQGLVDELFGLLGINQAVLFSASPYSCPPPFVITNEKFLSSLQLYINETISRLNQLETDEQLNQVSPNLPENLSELVAQYERAQTEKLARKAANQALWQQTIARYNQMIISELKPLVEEKAVTEDQKKQLDEDLNYLSNRLFRTAIEHSQISTREIIPQLIKDIEEEIAILEKSPPPSVLKPEQVVDLKTQQLAPLLISVKDLRRKISLLQRVKELLTFISRTNAPPKDIEAFDQLWTNLKQNVAAEKITLDKHVQRKSRLALTPAESELNTLLFYLVAAPIPTVSSVSKVWVNTSPIATSVYAHPIYTALKDQKDPTGSQTDTDISAKMITSREISYWKQKLDLDRLDPDTRVNVIYMQNRIREFMNNLDASLKRAGFTNEDNRRQHILKAIKSLGLYVTGFSVTAVETDALRISIAVFAVDEYQALKKAAQDFNRAPTPENKIRLEQAKKSFLEVFPDQISDYRNFRAEIEKYLQIYEPSLSNTRIAALEKEVRAYEQEQARLEKPGVQLTPAQQQQKIQELSTRVANREITPQQALALAKASGLSATQVVILATKLGLTSAEIAALATELGIDIDNLPEDVRTQAGITRLSRTGLRRLIREATAPSRLLPSTSVDSKFTFSLSYVKNQLIKQGWGSSIGNWLVNNIVGTGSRFARNRLLGGLFGQGLRTAAGAAVRTGLAAISPTAWIVIGIIALIVGLMLYSTFSDDIGVFLPESAGTARFGAGEGEFGLPGIQTIASGTCPLPEPSKIFRGTYHRDPQSGHGRADYWSDTRYTPFSFSIPDSGLYPNCMSPNNCHGHPEYYGQAIDVRNDPDFRVREVIVPYVCSDLDACNDQIITWQTNYYDPSRGALYLSATANNHTWKILLLHVVWNGRTTYTTEAGNNQVGYLQNLVNNQHLHFEITMDSIPIDPTPFCDGSGAGSSVVSGNCEIPSSGICSPASLSSFGANREEAAIVCFNESGGDPSALNDACRRSGTLDYSVGLFQINLLAHPSKPIHVPTGLKNLFVAAGLPEDTICPQAFSGATSPCTIVNRQILDICTTWFSDPVNNILYALNLSDGGNNWAPWKGTVNECSL